LEYGEKRKQTTSYKFNPKEIIGKAESTPIIGSNAQKVCYVRSIDSKAK
jgi:hypothetical protein